MWLVVAALNPEGIAMSDSIDRNNLNLFGWQFVGDMKKEDNAARGLRSCRDRRRCESLHIQVVSGHPVEFRPANDAASPATGRAALEVVRFE